MQTGRNSTSCRPRRRRGLGSSIRPRRGAGECLPAATHASASPATVSRPRLPGRCHRSARERGRPYRSPRTPALLVLRELEPRAHRQGARRPGGEPSFLGLLRRPLERRLHAQGHRSPDRGRRDLPESPAGRFASVADVAAFESESAAGPAPSRRPRRRRSPRRRTLRSPGRRDPGVRSRPPRTGRRRRSRRSRWLRTAASSSSGRTTSTRRLPCTGVRTTPTASRRGAGGSSSTAPGSWRGIRGPPSTASGRFIAVWSKRPGDRGGASSAPTGCPPVAETLLAPGDPPRLLRT